jgi:hypothetical protein
VGGASVLGALPLLLLLALAPLLLQALALLVASAATALGLLSTAGALEADQRHRLRKLPLLLLLACWGEFAC